MISFELGSVTSLTALIAVLSATWIFLQSNVKRCKTNVNLTGKTVLITGANSGIGYYTALDLAKRHARVILACRNEAKAQEASEKIKKESGNDNVVVRILNLSLMSSVREFATKFMAEEGRLDILINNAGVLLETSQITDEGLELSFATNHLGPFLLTNLLLDLMKKCAPSRIVTVSSVMNQYGTMEYDKPESERSDHYLRNYSDSKLANVLFTRELAERLKGTGVTANTLHPGNVSTQILRNRGHITSVLVPKLIQIFWKSAEDGAQTSIYLAVSDEVKDITGKYFSNCRLAEEEANPISRNKEVAAKLWNISENLTGLD